MMSVFTKMVLNSITRLNMHLNRLKQYKFTSQRLDNCETKTVPLYPNARCLGSQCIDTSFQAIPELLNEVPVQQYKLRSAKKKDPL